MFTAANRQEHMDYNRTVLQVLWDQNQNPVLQEELERAISQILLIVFIIEPKCSADGGSNAPLCSYPALIHWKKKKRKIKKFSNQNTLVWSDFELVERKRQILLSTPDLVPSPQNLVSYHLSLLHSPTSLLFCLPLPHCPPPHPSRVVTGQRMVIDWILCVCVCLSLWVKMV